MITDHRPLERIFGKNKNIASSISSRLIRWAIILSAYTFDIKYKSGSTNSLADFLSRCPAQEYTDPAYVDNTSSIGRILLVQQDAKLNKNLLKKHSIDDRTTQKIKHYLRFGWPNKGVLEHDFHPYYEKRIDISIEEEVLICQDRIIVPETLKGDILKYFHTGHPGITEMKSLSQYYVWWPSMNKDIEDYVNKCYQCQSLRKNVVESPLYSWNIMESSWTRIHVDLAGPIDNNYWLVIVDAHSKWAEVYTIKQITADNIINGMRDCFSRFRIPKVVVTDNGSQFISHTFSEFLSRNGVKHIKSSPYHPKTNGQVERTILR
ncbi:Transposon Ty3-G Gag-Pol polyprotein [Thelohanellus kitauei]|uniref:Transposon Ty3-G Gag-Pol polyprotein n=1 Tax=Thelohanellus kitauei TaxID=669202 RepID=A0A0C2MJ63_THEKT|nr:Transposon Ty3-G Gag-Pol polyprotein [Thelohanellus kitauei]